MEVKKKRRRYITDYLKVIFIGVIYVTFSELLRINLSIYESMLFDVVSSIPLVMLIAYLFFTLYIRVKNEDERCRVSDLVLSAILTFFFKSMIDGLGIIFNYANNTTNGFITQTVSITSYISSFTFLMLLSKFAKPLTKTKNIIANVILGYFCIYILLAFLNEFFGYMDIYISVK